MYFLIIIITILDQFTKQLIIRNINYNHEIEVIRGFFYLTNVRNKGAAWGIMQNYRIFFIVVTVVIVCAMLYFMMRVKQNYIRAVCSFMIGGAIGNFIDRLFRGYVIDFLDFYIGSYHFPTFNVADIFITIGTVVLLYEVFCKGKIKSYV